MTPARKPMIIEGMVPTKPAHGVMATMPATAPEAAPRVVTCLPLIFSTSSQPSMAAAGAMRVLSRAWAATPLAPSAEPALKPNQPNHRMPVPRRVQGRACGGMGSLPWPLRAPITKSTRQGGGAGVDVHDEAAGEVERTHLGDPATGERPVGDRA
jgi:hypothetical protein